MNEEERWLSGWFAKRASRSMAPANDGETNYFEAGWIDSLGIIELVTDLEVHFGLRFEERHFQDRRFATINGLALIVRELRAPPGSERG